MKKSYNVIGILALSLVCFFVGGYSAIEANNKKIKQKQDDNQTARAIYGLIVFANILNEVENGRLDKVNKYIATEMDLYAHEANKGNQHVIDAFKEKDITLVCQKMRLLGVNEKLDACKN